MEATIVGLLPLQLGRLLVWGEALPIHVMVYGRFERGRPRSGRSRVRFVLFWYGYCLHALENRRAWPTNAGRSAEDSRGSGLLRLAPIPGLDGPPSGGPRDGLTARTSMVAPHLLSKEVAHCLLTCLVMQQVAITYDAFGECWSVVDGATPVSQQNLSPMAHAFQPQGGVDHLGGVPMAYQSGPSAQGMCARPAACFMQPPTMMKPAVHPLGSLDGYRVC